MQHQNMIASATRDHVWARHITDSAQLLLHAPENDGGVWLDLGSGPGLPGLIIAILSGWRVDMVESRRGRINFLCRMIEELNLKQCSVHGCRLESLQFAGPSSIISARAFRSEEHTSELQSLMRTSYAVFRLQKKNNQET